MRRFGVFLRSGGRARACIMWQMTANDVVTPGGCAVGYSEYPGPQSPWRAVPLV